MHTDIEEEPMELRKDHPAGVEDSGEEDAAGGDSVIQTQQKERMHQKMVVMTQMVIQSQPLQQTPRRQSPIIRSKCIA